MFFKKDDLKSKLQGWKTVKICGGKFIIRRVNPLLDFPSDSMPQIFTSFVSRRKVEPEKDQSQFDQKKVIKDMMRVVEVGLVKPELVPISKSKEGITVEDIFIDLELGIKLYWEIIINSLNKFKGLKGLFFSIRLRAWLSTELRKNTDVLLSKSFSPMGDIV